MQLLEKILVPVDFSDGTDAMLRLASTLAGRLGAELLLQYVLPLPGEASWSETPRLLDAAQTSARARLDACRQTVLDAGAEIQEVLMDEGVPAERIVTRADEYDAQLIMIKASSNLAAGGLTLGMTAARVRRTAAQPVWLVHSATGQVPRVILCPVDLSAASERALALAIHLARQLAARLHVLTVVPLLTGWTSLLLSVDEAAEREQVRAQSDRFAALLRRFDWHDVTWEQSVRRGDPAEQIQAAVRELQAELLVMGSAGRSGLWRIFGGSVTEKIATLLPCSLLTMVSRHAERAKVDAQLTDLETHFARGRDLLKNGFPTEAERQFAHCVHINDMFAPGWEALAETHERRGDPHQAAECRETAARIRSALAWQIVEPSEPPRRPLWNRFLRRS